MKENSNYYEAKNSNYYETIFRLQNQLDELRGLSFFVRGNRSIFPLLASLIQFLFAICLNLISFYFAFIGRKFVDPVIFSIIFTISLVWIYFAYLNLKNAYSRFNRARRILRRIKSIEPRIKSLLIRSSDEYPKYKSIFRLFR
jgi:hypothetical protein